MFIRALVCDDEQSSVDTIVKCLNNYSKDRNLDFKIDAFIDGNSAINLDSYYNIAFLDIEINGVSGLDIAKKLKENNKRVIIFFITNYKKYIDDAMNLFALRFFEKPFEQFRFYNGLDKAIELINEDVVEFYLKDSNKIKRIKSREILCVEIGNHKTIVTTQDSTYVSSETISDWESKLTNVSFTHPHKSFIVNMEYIDDYKRNEVRLTNGKLIPIAYRKQTEFRKNYTDYLRRRK